MQQYIQYCALANFCLDPPSPSRSEYNRNNQNHLFCLSASSPQKIYVSTVGTDCYQMHYKCFVCKQHRSYLCNCFTKGTSMYILRNHKGGREGVSQMLTFAYVRGGGLKGRAYVMIVSKKMLNNLIWISGFLKKSILQARLRQKKILIVLFIQYFRCSMFYGQMTKNSR